MNVTRQFLLSSTLVFGFAGRSHAVIVFSNLDQVFEASSTLSMTTDRLATDFVTGSLPASVTGVTALMGNLTTLANAVTFSIFTDNGAGKPGALVDTFNTSALLPSGNSQLVTATDPGINLQANTVYWLVGQTTTIGSVNWKLDFGQESSGPFSVVPTTVTQLSLDSGVSYGNSGQGNLIFALDGNVVPEPTSLGFAVVGIVGCGRRRLHCQS